MADLVEDFNEGRVQFAYLKVKDPNSGLPKNVLIAWCGGGVPERTKGYFTSHLAVVSKLLHGYHVQITARSDSDVAPEAIIQKVADSSGSKYSASSSAAPAPVPRPPPGATKPVFTPTTSGAGRINPALAARNRRGDEDADGWGADAPQVTRTQVERVQPAYKPTKVNMAELTGQKSADPPRHNAPAHSGADVIGGGYQPVGKIDIGAIRAAAKNKEDLRPAPVKGAYEPVGKVDIGAIKSRSQPPREEEEPQASRGLADRSAAFSPPQQSERLTSMPKPKVANKFGSSASSFTGTKPPAPGGLSFNKPAAPPPVVGAASRTFADQGGKTPAQIWAEKKGKRDSTGAPATVTPPMASPITSQKSGGGWKSGYAGKSWNVQAPSYNRSIAGQATGDSERSAEAQEQAPESPAGGVSAMQDRFKDAQPIAPAAPSAAERYEPPPPPPSSNRPQGGHQLPGLPSRAPPAAEDDYEEARERSPSPVRVAVPVARGPSPPPEPVRELPSRPKVEEPEPVQEPAAETTEGGPSAVALYDYEKSEDNEIELREDDYVVDIDMVDDDWWVGTTSQGERGLFPSNYVQLVDGDQQAQAEPEPAPAPAPVPAPAPAAQPAGGHTATALFDYEAAEDNGWFRPWHSGVARC
ncbi:hypothetical protein IMZ48_01240 [Candidatus Bathyarchaeota archaeon]|nr:hypothetical protein [Candidatus Bathyarchaeota archaeon]